MAHAINLTPEEVTTLITALTLVSPCGGHSVQWALAHKLQQETGEDADIDQMQGMQEVVFRNLNESEKG